MKRIAAVLVLEVVFALSVGCTPPGSIRSDALEGLVAAVSSRHDLLCSNPDAMKALGLDPDKAESYKRSTEILRQMIATAKADGEKAKAKQ